MCKCSEYLCPQCKADIEADERNRLAERANSLPGSPTYDAAFKHVFGDDVKLWHGAESKPVVKDVPPSGLKLNLGAGRNLLVDYTNIDRMYANGYGAGNQCVSTGDVYPLSGYADNTVEIVRSSHVLEHFPHRETMDILTDWVRVLAPGGWLKIAVPDFAKIAAWYAAGAEGLPLEGYCMGGQTDENDFHKAIFDDRSLRRAFAQLGLVEIQHWTSEIEDCAALPVSLNLMGRKLRDGEEWTESPLTTVSTMTMTTERTGVEVDGWHVDIPFKEGAVELLDYRGFKFCAFKYHPKDEEWCAHIEAPNGSMIEADQQFEKAKHARRHARETIDAIIDTAALIDHPDARFAGTEIPKGTVVPIFTAPRLGFTSFAHCALQSFVKLGIDPVIQGGAYWHQGIETCAEKAIDKGAKYVLALDYDTVFDHRDIEALYGIMEARPDIAALCPVQMRREVETALFTVHDADGKNVDRVKATAFDNDVTRIASGHLGLTLIRAECLRNTPKPWFHAIPAPAPSWPAWDGGHVDADIAFWAKFREAGHSLYLANRVVIGHLELVANWPSTDLTPIVQHASDYHEAGRPKAGSGIWR